MYNKFQKPRENKHGFIDKMKERLDDLNSASFAVDYGNAIPIWELFHMTEAEYHIKYTLNVPPIATTTATTTDSAIVGEESLKQSQKE